MAYPQFHHLGFKILCGCMIIRAVNYITFSEHHLQRQTDLLETIRNNTRK